MGPERLDRARTVESTAAFAASCRPPLASAGSVRYPPRIVGLAPDAAVSLLGAAADGYDGLIFPAVDSAGRSVGAGRRNCACVADIGIAPARGHAARAGLQRDGGPVRAAHSLSNEAPISLPRNSSAMVPTTVAAIPDLPFPAVNPSTPPATPPSPAPVIRSTP